MIGSELGSRFDEVFSSSIRPWKDGSDPLSLLFSGGVDSGLIGWELRDRPNFVLSTVGTPGSPDLDAARTGAVVIGARWAPSELTAADVREVSQRIAREVEGLPRTARSVLVSFALALERTPSHQVLCGQGADELFLGYAHYRGLDAEAAAARSESDLRQLLESDWPASQRIASQLGRAVAAPYLDPEFIAAARSIPIERRMPDPAPKAFFREWATRRGLPPSIAFRPKRALQFGSGVDRLVP